MYDDPMNKCLCETDSEHDDHIAREIAEHEEMLMWDRHLDEFGQSYYTEIVIID